MSEAVPVSVARTPRSARIALGAVGLLLVALTIQNIWGVDIWWQMRTGQWVVQHRAVPVHDELSYSVVDHPWIEMRWIYCVLVYLGWQAGGAALLILAQSVVVLATFVLLVAPRLRTAAMPVGLLLLTLGIVTASTRFVVRPELITFLMMCAFLVILDRRRNGPTRWVWALPILQVLWTNAHTLFVLGPLLAWMFAGDALWRQWRGPSVANRSNIKPAIIVALLTTAACWINPYGHAGATFPLLLFSEIHEGSLLGTTILEFRSPFVIDTWSWTLRGAALFTMLTAATFAWNWRRTDFVRLALFAAMIYLACTALRNIALLGFVGTWAALGNLANRPFPTTRFRAAANSLLTLGLLVGVWWVVTDRYYRASGLTQEFGLGVLAWETPTAATQFMLDAGAEPNVFHAMADGAYLTWAAQGRLPVFIDGRLEVYGEPFIREYLNVASGFRDWDDFADRHHINVAMLQREHLVRIVEQLRRSQRWVLVHLDWREVVFVRNIPAHAELIRKYRIDLWRPFTPRGPEPDELPTGWRRAMGAVGSPWYSMGMANAFLLLGSADNAARYLEQGVARFPDNDTMRMTLATIRRLRGRDAEADALLAPIPPSAGAQVQQDLLLASMLESEQRWPEAIAAMKRAAAASPGDAGMFARIGQLYVTQGDAAHAIEAYRQAVRFAPKNAFYWFELGQVCELRSDAEGAMAAYRKAVEHGAELFRAQYRLGLLLMRAGDRAAARECFEAALRASPGYQPASDALATLHASPG